MKDLVSILLCLLFSTAVSGEEDMLPPMPGLVDLKATPTPESTPTGSAATESGTPAPEVSPAPGTPDGSAPDLASAAPAAPGTSPAGTATPGETPPSETKGEANKVDFLRRSNLVHTKILENERPVDPFGMIMDPANAKSTPVLADQYKEEEEATPQLNNSSLKSALMTLPITGVYPAKGMLVIGARSFEVGGQFGMRLQDLTIRLRFEGIREGEIYFKDMETREVTSIPFNPRPAEFEPMRKGAKREAGPGILAMDDLYIAN